jgi:DNA-binding MarR family transcriptional regulator
VTLQSTSQDQKEDSREQQEQDNALVDPLFEIVELLFFSYRDFISDPDEILTSYGFGRAHHRVLHFVNRYPGMRIAELLDILKITKQSLARVLRQLIDDGFIEQRAGESDRRQRLLFPTKKGRDLFTNLVRPQLRRIAEALENVDEKNQPAARQLLYNLIDEKERAKVRHMISRRSS